MSDFENLRSNLTQSIEQFQQGVTAIRDARRQVGAARLSVQAGVDATNQVVELYYVAERDYASAGRYRYTAGIICGEGLQRVFEVAGSGDEVHEYIDMALSSGETAIRQLAGDVDINGANIVRLAQAIGEDLHFIAHEAAAIREIGSNVLASLQQVDGILNQAMDAKTHTIESIDNYLNDVV